MKYKKYVSTGLVLASFATLTIFAVPALADTATVSASATANGMWQGRLHAGLGTNRPMMKPGVFGTVSAVNSDTLTVTGRIGFGTTATSTTYTVDATNATVTKNGVASTVSAIAVGDTIMAQGTVTGTNVTATTIRDGVMQRPAGAGKMGMSNQTISTVTGNGQPVVGGKVTAISGSSLTITNNSNVTYTVDASNAKFNGAGVTSISNISVGDSILAQGLVSGSSVTASSVIDQKAPTTSTKPAGKGFFGSIGSFFSHLFGF